MDKAWWDIYYNDVNENFDGQLFTCNPIKHDNIPKLNRNYFKGFGNSGANAVSLAYHGGAKKIILLGYDCQKTEGQTHWHGDHVKGLGNATRIEIWPEKFKLLSEYCNDCNIVNATRQTALNCFPKTTIYEALWR